MRFFLGTHRPSWLFNVGVPLFLSASTLHTLRWERRRTPLRNGSRWAFDSGAFTANSPLTGGNPNHPWHLGYQDFGGMVARVIGEIGYLPDFAAPQDLPCEPGVRAVTGFTVAIHQELTCDSYQSLAGEFEFIPWAPVLQGWETGEYLQHMAEYKRRGVDLAACGTVGLGSVCRRGSAKPIVTIVEAVQAHALELFGARLRLHGFGMNIEALRRCAHLLDSSDSLAWSDGARHGEIRLPECTHGSRFCNNCQRYALQWRDRVLAAVNEPKQLSLDAA